VTAAGARPDTGSILAAMTQVGLPVELVIQTSSGVLEGRFAPREAVTILASQTPQARGAARRLARSDPERASAYAEVLRAIGRELRDRADQAEHPGALRSVIEDLVAILDALKG
jgi:hypothetical protein